MRVFDGSRSARARSSASAARAYRVSASSRRPSRAATCACDASRSLFSWCSIQDMIRASSTRARRRPTPRIFEISHDDQACLEADDSRQRRQVAVALGGLSQLGVETLSDDRFRPAIHAGHFQTPAVLEIVDRGAGLCDVIVHAGSDLRPAARPRSRRTVRSPRARRPRRRPRSRRSRSPMRRAFVRPAVAMRRRPSIANRSGQGRSPWETGDVDPGTRPPPRYTSRRSPW